MDAASLLSQLAFGGALESAFRCPEAASCPACTCTCNCGAGAGAFGGVSLGIFVGGVLLGAATPYLTAWALRRLRAPTPQVVTPAAQAALPAEEYFTAAAQAQAAARRAKRNNGA